MCVGSSRSARAGSAARSGLGRAAQRRVQTQSTKTVFNPGKYRVQTGTSQQYQDLGGEGGVEELVESPRYRTFQINNRAELNALNQRRFTETRKTPIYEESDDNEGLGRHMREVGQKTSTRTFGGNARRVRGSETKNVITPDKQARVQIADEGKARIKTRQARSGMREEANARSRSTRKKGRGLRIGGSGVSVPGSTGVQ